MKYAWIDTQRKGYPLPLMCDVLTVISISGYRAWKRGGSQSWLRLIGRCLNGCSNAAVKVITYWSMRWHIRNTGGHHRL